MMHQEIDVLIDASRKSFAYMPVRARPQATGKG